MTVGVELVVLVVQQRKISTACVNVGRGPVDVPLGNPDGYIERGLVRDHVHGWASLAVETSHALRAAAIRRAMEDHFPPMVAGGADCEGLRGGVEGATTDA